MKSQEKLSLLSELLDIERKQDFQLYREKVLLKSLKERVEEGVCWYPVDLKRLYVGTGEKIIVEIKRTDDKEGKRPNALQAGSLVTVFGMNADREAGQAGGVVYSLRKGSMKIVLSSDEIPAWLQDSRIGVNLDFDDKTYREMQAAIKQVASAKKDRLAELREILMGGHEPAFGEWEYTFRHPLLNSSQEKAVQKVLEAKDVALIHGPPGTGKTTTLVHAIQEVLQREHQVLVCAPSNTATDLLTIRCAEMGLNPVRLGNPARVDESLQLHTLDSTIARHEDYGALKKLRVESEQLYRKASKYKRRMDRDQYQRKREVLREARDLKRYAETLEDYIIGQVMDRSQVVCATLSGAGHKLLLKRKFNTVFIDEAGQA
ncbi:MAG: AAA domain-containing protein, partial [Bacteroidota bacterium]